MFVAGRLEDPTASLRRGRVRIHALGRVEVAVRSRCWRENDRGEGGRRRKEGESLWKGMWLGEILQCVRELASVHAHGCKCVLVGERVCC